jgi:predicted dinucleotide-binding enzyme
MRITIIGAGNVGAALANGRKKAGHEPAFAMRDPESDSSRKAKAAGFSVGGLADAGEGDVVVLAVPWPAVEEALKGAGALVGKILVDATNPLDKNLDLAFGYDDSAGETVSRLVRGARVVKAFNTTGADNMDKASAFPVKPMMPIAGDDAEAKDVVSDLAEALGFEAVDAGPLSAARLLEPLALFWIKQAFGPRGGSSFAYAFVTRP